MDLGQCYASRHQPGNDLFSNHRRRCFPHGSHYQSGIIQAINGGSLVLNGLSNTGSILANGTSMSFTGNWSNAGTITATNSTVSFGGTFTPAGIGTFIRSGGTVTINGTVNNYRHNL